MSDDILQIVLDLQARIEALELELKRKKHKKIDQQLDILVMKKEFIDSLPDKRTDPFSNYELVFWHSYLLRNTKKLDKVDNLKELALRANKIGGLIKFFKENLKNKTEDGIRLFIKDYFEYCVTVAKDVNNEPLGFYQSTSDWGISSFTSKANEWRKIKNLLDEEP